jgi:hypothetical protein
LNAEIIRRRNQLTQEEKMLFASQKIEIVEQETITRRQRDELRKQIKDLRTILRQAKTEESTIRRIRGRADKTLCNGIESDVLKLHSVLIS